MGNEIDETNVTEMEDMEIAELANAEIRKRDKEINDLKKMLAKQKLLSNSDEQDEDDKLSVKECIDVTNNPNTGMYDYVKAAIDYYDQMIEKDGHSVFGSNGESVRQFLSDCIDACDGDKDAFVSVYQSALQPDDKSISASFAGRKR